MNAMIRILDAEGGARHIHAKFDMPKAPKDVKEFSELFTDAIIGLVTEKTRQSEIRPSDKVFVLFDSADDYRTPFVELSRDLDRVISASQIDKIANLSPDLDISANKGVSIFFPKSLRFAGSKKAAENGPSYYEGVLTVKSDRDASKLYNISYLNGTIYAEYPMDLTDIPPACKLVIHGDYPIEGISGGLGRFPSVTISSMNIDGLDLNGPDDLELIEVKGRPAPFTQNVISTLSISSNGDTEISFEPGVTVGKLHFKSIGLQTADISDVNIDCLIISGDPVKGKSLPQPSTPPRIMKLDYFQLNTDSKEAELIPQIDVRARETISILVAKFATISADAPEVLVADALIDVLRLSPNVKMTSIGDGMVDKLELKGPLDNLTIYGRDALVPIIDGPVDNFYLLFMERPDYSVSLNANSQVKIEHCQAGETRVTAPVVKVESSAIDRLVVSDGAREVIISDTEIRQLVLPKTIERIAVNGKELTGLHALPEPEITEFPRVGNIVMAGTGSPDLVVDREPQVMTIKPPSHDRGR